MSYSTQIGVQSNCTPNQNRTATQASEYVTKGMMRFVSGQYSPTWPLGAMLGYVMDGNMQTAYIVVTSFFPSLIGTCEVERLIISCGSRPPFAQESPRCPWFAFFSIG